MLRGVYGYGNASDLGCFLWEEADGEGNEDPLSQIEFFFDEGILAGLVFSYSETMAQKSMGICEGVKVPICLRRHEKILALDVDHPGELIPGGVALVVVSEPAPAVDGD